jgi:anti-sigma factor RsiW
MKPELELKLQAYLDGELSPREAREVAASIERDPEAQQLVAELKTTAAVLRDNEPQLALPESREFYWSKIQRAIEHAEPEPVAPLVAFWFAFRRVLVPLAGVALVLFLGIASFNVGPANDPLAHLAEVESLSEHMSSFSFRSQSHNVFVVWLHENSDHEGAADVEGMDFDDEILQ